MPRRKTPEYLQRLTDVQVADFRCGIDGCRFGGRMTMAAWLEARDAHREVEHAGFRERKRHRHSIPGINRNPFTEAAS